MNDELYIKRCIELAKKGAGNTYPNPMVGSVIVYGGLIIGEGYHQKAGEPHAEINAINSVQNPELLRESTIYVSLEPCAHFGKTPPCADKIVETGFRRVVIGCPDLHDKVNGKGENTIREAGIEVVSGILQDECRELNKRFFTFHQKKRPYIILKWAQSSDGFLDRDHKPTRISNALADMFVHQMRSDEHAILVGTKTALSDNPSLTVRHLAGENPVRILINMDLIVPPHYRIFDGEARTLVFNAHQDYDQENIKYIKIERENVAEAILQKLYEEQIQSVIVEGGGQTLQHFIDQGLWDETVIIKNEELTAENGTRAPAFNAMPYLTKKFRSNTLEFFRQ